MALTLEERGRLESFREAARQVRDASIISQGQRIMLRAMPGQAGYVDVYIQLLGNEAFRSLALAVRLIYLKGEPAFFFSMCNILSREGDASVRTRVAQVRAQYQAALSNLGGAVSINDGRDPPAYSAEAVFDHWLYGIAFHQDVNRREAVKRLASTGPQFPWSVQATGLQLAGRILDLDDLVAEFLGEPQLPRL